MIFVHYFPREFKDGVGLEVEGDESDVPLVRVVRLSGVVGGREHRRVQLK